MMRDSVSQTWKDTLESICYDNRSPCERWRSGPSAPYRIGEVEVIVP